MGRGDGVGSRGAPWGAGLEDRVSSAGIYWAVLGASYASVLSNRSSSAGSDRVGMPNFSALASLDPASAPTTT
jgi:hypothetical protein